MPAGGGSLKHFLGSGVGWIPRRRHRRFTRVRVRLRLRCECDKIPEACAIRRQSTVERVSDAACCITVLKTQPEKQKCGYMELHQIEGLVRVINTTLE